MKTLYLSAEDEATPRIAAEIIKNGGLVAVPTEKPISINVSLVWKRDAYFFGCMRSFRNFVQGMKK